MFLEEFTLMTGFVVQGHIYLLLLDDQTKKIILFHDKCYLVKQCKDDDM